MYRRNSRSSIVICPHQHINASILVDQVHTTNPSGKTDGLYAYDKDAEYTAISRLFVEFFDSGCSMGSFLEGQSDSDIVGGFVFNEVGRNNGPTPSEDSLSDVGTYRTMRKEKAYLDICGGGAFDKPIYLNNISGGSRTCTLDAYSASGSCFLDCTLDEVGIGFARGSGRSGQAGGK